MNDESSKTPYNSIYQTLKTANQKQVPELICCRHGRQCPYGREPVENQYVDLAVPSKEQQVADKLAAKLKKLEVEQNQQQQQQQQQNKKNKKKGSKDSSREKRKKKSLVEDNHAYVMLGPTTEETTATSAPITTESLENVKANNALSCYIGVHTSPDAESQVTQRGEFALYHQFEAGKCIDNLTAGLPLMLVYFTTTKKHRHYPIRTSGKDGDVYFTVDCGYPIVRKHKTLNQLVQYYKTFGSIQIFPDDMCSEGFSWWLE